MSEISIKEKSNTLKDIAFGMRVLFAEDDLIIQEQFKTFLLRFFAHIDTANNGVEALEYYAKNKYDLVITDLSMPQMNGIELSRHIKDTNEDQFIIVVSAHSESDKLINLINIGVDGFILKPVDIPLVIQQLLKICTIISDHNMLEYYNKLLEDTNIELERSNVEYQIALNELMQLRTYAQKDTKTLALMSASEYNHLYSVELFGKNDNLEEVEHMLNALVLDTNYPTQIQTVFKLRNMFKIYADEILVMPRFKLLSDSMSKLEQRMSVYEDTTSIANIVEMVVSIITNMERWRLGVLKYKYMEDIHAMDNELVHEVHVLERFLSEGSV